MCACTPECKTPFCGKPGCEWPKPDPDAQLAQRRRKAHTALDAAAKAWYEYAGYLDDERERIDAFRVYGNILAAIRA